MGTPYVYQNGAWREAKTVSVYQNSAWRSVSSLSVRDTFNGTPAWRDASPVTTTPATNLRVTTSLSSIETFSSMTVTVQLRDANNNATPGLSAASVTITASPGTGTGYFLNSSNQEVRTITQNTNSTGTITLTYYSKSTNVSSATMEATATGLTSGSATFDITLRTGLTPVFGANTSADYGFRFPHTNVNTTDYAYSGSVSGTNNLALANPNGSFLNAVTSNPVQVFIQTALQIQGSISQNTTDVSVAGGLWAAGTTTYGLSATITTERAGYTSGSRSTSTGFALSTNASLTYTFRMEYALTQNPVSWSLWVERVGQTSASQTFGKGTFYNNNVKNRWMRCVVTAYRTYAGAAIPDWGGNIRVYGPIQAT